MNKPRRLWRTIVVPHDFSSSANQAAAIARDEAKLHDGELLLLHVVELPQNLALDSAFVIRDDSGAPIGMREFAVTSATDHLEGIANRLRADGVPATAYVRVGNPVDEIDRFVEEQKADVIVMGTHGRTGVRRLVAGSVTERVVRTASVPVFTIRHDDT